MGALIKVTNSPFKFPRELAEQQTRKVSVFEGCEGDVGETLSSVVAVFTVESGRVKFGTISGNVVYDIVGVGLSHFPCKGLRLELPERSTIFYVLYTNKIVV